MVKSQVRDLLLKLESKERSHCFKRKTIIRVFYVDILDQFKMEIILFEDNKNILILAALEYRL